MIGTFLPFSPKIKEGIGELFTFPITISLEEPQNPSVGDIWVKTNKTFSKMHFTDAIGLNEENDTLIFLINNQFEMKMSGKYTLNSDSNMEECMVDIKKFSYNSGTEKYIISNINEENKLSLNFSVSRPKVYSKNNDIVEMEDAFVYLESGWFMISVKSNYVLVAEYVDIGTIDTTIAKNPSLYNNIIGDLNFVENIPADKLLAGANILTFNNPNYCYIQDHYRSLDVSDEDQRSGIYKLVGDHLEPYFILKTKELIPDCNGENIKECYCCASNGTSFTINFDHAIVGNEDLSEILVVYVTTRDTSIGNCQRVVRYKNTGNGFVFDKTIAEYTIKNNDSVAFTYNNNIFANKNLSVIFVGYGYSGSDSSILYYHVYFRDENGNYVEGTVENSNNINLTLRGSTSIALFNREQDKVLLQVNNSVDPVLIKINYDTKSISAIANVITTSIFHNANSMKRIGCFNLPIDDSIWVYFITGNEASESSNNIHFVKINENVQTTNGIQYYGIEKDISFISIADVNPKYQLDNYKYFGSISNVSISADGKYLFIAVGSNKGIILVYELTYDIQTETLSAKFKSKIKGNTTTTASVNTSQYYQCIPFGTDPCNTY